MAKLLPKIKSDRAAKNLLKTDLSQYMSRENFSKNSFEFAQKDKSITLRVSAGLLEALQNEAKKKDIPYQRVIREAIEKYLKEAA